MANVYLTQAEIDSIRALAAKMPNGSGNYTDIYKLIGDILATHEGAANVTNWFRGAEQANGGNGTFSVLIRTYSRIQMVLRGIGDSYTDSLMQSASNRVAERALNDILDEKARRQPDGSWLFPTIDEIATNDAVGVGEVLFASLPTEDSARKSNAAWAGTTLFSVLNSSQGWRLTSSAGGVDLDRLEDIKNVLFAYAAMEISLAQNFVGLINDLIDLRNGWQYLKDGIIGFTTTINTTPEMLGAIMFNNLTAILPENAKPIGKLIEQAGTMKVAEWIESTLAGKPVPEGSGSINGAFGAINLADQRAWEVRLLPTDVDSIVALARTNAAARNALLALSPISITKPSYENDTSQFRPMDHRS